MTAEAAQLVVQFPGPVGEGEAVDPFGGGGEQDPVPGLAGSDGDADGQVGSRRCRAALDQISHR
jgi:hypothetical protein